MSEFVFREGVNGQLEFVGDFEALYAADPMPWGQDGSGELAAYYRRSRVRLADELAMAIPFTSATLGAEVGCGLGYALAELARSCGGGWCGMDVSAEAVRKARELHPGLDFEEGDIRTYRFAGAGLLDVVVLNEVLWYIMASAEEFHLSIDNALSMVKPGGLLVVSQAFLREQRYGADIAEGFHGTLAQLWAEHPGMYLVRALFDDSRDFSRDHGLLMFRKVRA